MLLNNSPSFSLSISTGRQLKGKACQCGLHFTTPPPQEKEKRSSEHIGRQLKGKACPCGLHFTTPLPTREREA